MNLSDTDINDMSIIRTCLLITVGALALQTYFILDSLLVFWWEDWFVRGNDPEWAFMMIVLGLIALSSYMIFLSKLYKIFRTEVKKGVFGWAVFFGVLSFVAPVMHFMHIPLSLLEFNVVVSVGFGAVIAHRILLGMTFSKTFSNRTKKWIKFSAAFKVFSLSILIFLMTTIIQGRMTWRENWLDGAAWDIYFLIPILGPASQNDMVLTNILLVVDLIIFSTVLIFGFWNLPKKAAEKTEFQKLADKY